MEDHKEIVLRNLIKACNDVINQELVSDNEYMVVDYRLIDRLEEVVTEYEQQDVLSKIRR